MSDGVFSNDAVLDCSVIVPIYNDWDQVDGLLQCLRNQSMDAKDFEIILVDNGSENLPPVPGGVQLVICSTPGSYAARNAGIAVARGSLLAFTDADCLPHGDWLAQGFACSRQSDDDVIIAGAVEMTPVTGSPGPVELYDLTLGLPQSRYVSRGYGVTANLFVPRRIFEAVGVFDAGRFSGGDAAFCRAARASGFKTIYCREAMVRHPARTRWKDLATKLCRVRGGQIRRGSLARRAFYLVRAILPPVEQWFRIFRTSGLSKSDKLRVSCVEARLWLAGLVEVFRLLLGARPKRR